MKLHSASILLLLLEASTASRYETFRKVLTSELDHQPQDEATLTLEMENDFLLDHFNIEEDESYMLCNSSDGMSGYSRQMQIRGIVGDSVVGQEMPVLYNTHEMSCFLATLTASEATAVQTQGDNDTIVAPLTAYMKLRANTVALLEDSELKYKQLNVMLCPRFFAASSTDMANSSSVMMQSIVNKIESNKQSAARRFLWTSDSPKLKHEKYDGIRRLDTAHGQHSLKWKNAMERGLIAEHGCSSMFEKLSIDSISREEAMINLGEEPSVECAMSLVAALSSQVEVCSVETVSKAESLNLNAQWIIQSGVSQSRPWFDAGLDGTGQIVDVSDSGLDTNHCSFWDSTPGELRDGTNQPTRRKVVRYEAYQDDSDYSNGHGTHVVGTIAGRCSSDGTVSNESSLSGHGGNGVAPGAKISFFDIGNGTTCCYLPSISSVLDGGYSAGAKFHSASWGTSDSGYISMSRGFDDFLYNNDDYLAMVAAGNSGASNGYNTMNSVGAPATAKNIISVGASEAGNIGYLAYFSSRGPTKDGRSKPDIIAPGYSLYSASANPTVVGESSLSYKAGTSMATPAVSGAAALVRQYFTDGYYPTGGIGNAPMSNPSGQLVKAVLLNGAQSLNGVNNGGTITPVSEYDLNQNFGRLSLIDSLPLNGQNNFKADVVDRKAISQNEIDTFSYNIGSCANVNEVRVTLTWADPAAASGCTNCLLNNLDLELEVGGTVYYPNGLNGPDVLNNAERIRVSVTSGDGVTVRVRASNLSSASQNYAMVVTGCLVESNPVTQSPTASPTQSPVTSSPTQPPVTASPTQPPVTVSPTQPPVTASPTQPPVTASPTQPPVTSSPTQPPVTIAPTASPTQPPNTASPTQPPVIDVCSGLLKPKDCKDQPGCFWDGFCKPSGGGTGPEPSPSPPSPTPPPPPPSECSAFSKPNLCKNQPGCFWDGVCKPSGGGTGPEPSPSPPSPTPPPPPSECSGFKKTDCINAGCAWRQGLCVPF